MKTWVRWFEAGNNQSIPEVGANYSDTQCLSELLGIACRYIIIDPS
jgi:hypothetical protein